MANLAKIAAARIQGITDNILASLVSAGGAVLITYLATNLTSIQALSLSAKALILIAIFLFAMLIIGGILWIYKSAVKPSQIVEMLPSVREKRSHEQADHAELEIRFYNKWPNYSVG